MMEFSGRLEKKLPYSLFLKAGWCTELGGTLKTHLYNSTFYSFLQFALTFSPTYSIPLEILHTSSRYVVSDFNIARKFERVITRQCSFNRDR